ncbi:MAG: CBS domain-containing protein [Rhodospirillaceae bacterium]|nr:CBS domain-containing protein [Rhodospirillaceae bacterium]
MIVSQILRDKGSAVLTVAPEATAVEAARIMNERRVGALVVRRGPAKLEGIISERDIVVALAEQGPEAAERPVHSLMTAADRLITCAPGDSVAHIMAVMTDRRVRHLPVIENGRLAGIISIGDIVKARLRETLAEVEAMTAYVRG